MNARAVIGILLSLCIGLLTACSSPNTAGRLPSDSPNTPNTAISYDDVKGSGLANQCPQLAGSTLEPIAIDTSQFYSIKDFCLQPEKFLVRSDSPLMKRQKGEFVDSKLLTRKSFTLDQVRGEMQVDSEGYVTLVSKGGFDFQPVTVQLPDGERVPLLFTIKGLVAKTPEPITNLTPATRLAGSFNVPPYRTSSFIDPKGRGLAVGYDAAVGIPIQADRQDFYQQNNKSFEVDQGSIILQINRVNRSTGELSGRFESEQPSDTDFGSKTAMTVKVQGQFYGRIEPKIT